MHIPTPSELKAKRVMLGLKQSEVAERASISQSMVARIEAGTVDPRVSTIAKIVSVLRAAERSAVTATDLMHTPVYSVPPGETVNRTVQIMEENGISQLPVIDGGVPVGCISESAIINALEEGRVHKIQNHTVSEFMEDGFPTVSPHTDVDTLVHLLHTHHAILVVDKGQVQGVITKHDLISLIR
ncbi:MAG: CBS domain-containing protein [Methanomicrobiales archaeon]|nr:CBS domain-containing protein [Methanomicrobiales archaeon]